MNNYICKIADLNEMNTKWDYEISIHPGDISWSLYKTKFIESAKKGNRVSYYGILNGKIICEATAIFNKEDVEGLDEIFDIYVLLELTKKKKIKDILVNYIDIWNKI